MLLGDYGWVVKTIPDLTVIRDAVGNCIVPVDTFVVAVVLVVAAIVDVVVVRIVFVDLFDERNCLVEFDVVCVVAAFADGNGESVF